MNIALPALFVIAALASVMAMWHAIVSNWQAIVDLRARASMTEHGSAIVVHFIENSGELDAVSAVRRPRQLRVPAPKPVTHRLHHFARSRSVA